MPEKKKMICPRCGAEMNQHAEKLDFGTASIEPEEVDPVLGGVVEEVHTCPKCCQTEMRRGQ